MKIRAELYLSPYVDCDENREDSICAAVWDGIWLAEQVRHDQGENEAALLSLHSVEFVLGGAEEQALDIRSTPTLVFLDDSRNIALTKLTKGQISTGNVKRTFLYLAALTPSGVDDTYIDANGDEVGQKDLIDMWGSGGWGLGLGQVFGCPKWMPRAICNFPFWVLTMALILIALLFILKLRK